MHEMGRKERVIHVCILFLLNGWGKLKGKKKKGYQKLTTIRIYWASSDTRPTAYTASCSPLARWGRALMALGFAALVEGGAPGYGAVVVAVVGAEFDAVFTAGDGAPARRRFGFRTHRR